MTQCANWMANSVEPDQITPCGAVWSEATLFAHARLSKYLKNPAITFQMMPSSSWEAGNVFKYSAGQMAKPWGLCGVCVWGGEGGCRSCVDSVDPDQTSCSAASYLGLHCLLRPVRLKA